MFSVIYMLKEIQMEFQLQFAISEAVVQPLMTKKLPDY